MKILFLSHYFPPEVNAPASRTFDHCKRWVEAGHDVTVVTCAPNCPDGVVYEGYSNTFRRQTEYIDGIQGGSRLDLFGSQRRHRAAYHQLPFVCWGGNPGRNPATTPRRPHSNLSPVLLWLGGSSCFSADAGAVRAGDPRHLARGNRGRRCYPKPVAAADIGTA